jgi:hypothetical protein
MPEDQSPSPTATRADVARASAAYLDCISADGGFDSVPIGRAAALLREMAAAQEEMLAALREIAAAEYNCTTQQMWMPMQDAARAAIARAEAAQ